MFSHTWKGKVPTITKPALGHLKPASSNDNKPNVSECSEPMNIRIANLERLATQQVDEICELRRQLLAEKSKNMELEQKINEMTQFLEDYGLHWVGGPPPSEKMFENGPDSSIFMSKIEELNRIAEPGKVEFVQNGNISTLKQHKPILITLCNDGFKLDNGPLRLYEKPVNQEFLKDIIDGFFPQEFKEQYPDGVKFKVEDKRRKKEAKQQNLSNSANLEMLPPPTDIGSGDGSVKVRIPALPEVIIHISKTMHVYDLLSLIEDSFDIHQIKLTSPLSTEAFDENALLSDIGLYPRGYAIVVYK